MKNILTNVDFRFMHKGMDYSISTLRDKEGDSSEISVTDLVAKLLHLTGSNGTVSAEQQVSEKQETKEEAPEVEQQVSEKQETKEEAPKPKRRRRRTKAEMEAAKKAEEEAKAEEQEPETTIISTQELTKLASEVAAEVEDGPNVLLNLLKKQFGTHLVGSIPVSRRQEAVDAMTALLEK